MEHLPSQGNVALQVLWLADDPSTALEDLAGAVAGDPALVARLLRLANSAYYSPRSPISSVDRAIMLLGFTTVRTIATVVACGLDSNAVPPGFWRHSSATATAAQLIAWRFGINSGEAFAVGLLHDLGRGLLHVADPVSSAELDQQLADAALEEPSPPNTVPTRLDLERELFGITHAEAAARLLGSWRFAPPMVEAIGEHHRPIGDPTSELTKLIGAAEAITARAIGSFDEPVDGSGGIELLDLDHERLELIVHRVRSESGALAAVLSI